MVICGFAFLLNEIAAGFALAMTVKPNALAILATLVAFAHCVRSAKDGGVGGSLAMTVQIKTTKKSTENHLTY